MSTTPFEDSGKLTLTNLAQETAFVDALAAAHPGTVTKVALGVSVQARPIYALRFGNPTGARPVVCMTTIHGDENVPREAALTLARDLCETTPPPAVAALLADRALWLIPTPNPDGFPNSRTNANAEDLNRHYLDLHPDSAETALIAELVYDIDPVAFLDCHEWNGQGADGTFVGNSTFASVHRDIRAASVDVGESMMAALTAAGASTGWYPRDSTLQTVLHWTAEIGIVPSLIETTCAWGTITTGRPDRHDWQRVAIGAWLTHLSTAAAEWEAASAAARTAAASKVARTDTAWTIDLQAPMHVGGTTTGTAVSAVAYTGTLTDALDALAAHGITHDGTTVSLEQERAPLAVHLLDPLSDAALATVTRTAPNPVTWTPAPSPTPAFQLWPTPPA